ncbi:MAG: ATP-binding cassette domain-containing protein [Phycisphaerales bacterium JB061]
MSDLAIDLTGVSKNYTRRFKKPTPALRGVDMRVHRGEVFGLLGPNGAGKSTLVKILMTVIRPTNCQGTVLGQRVGHKPTLARVGYLPEHHSFPGYLTGAQVIDFFGAMTGVPRRERKQRAGELLELVGMSEWAKRKLKSYSKGMRQRIGIAQALVNDPELVLLDEPTDGVDPVGRRDIRGVIERIKDEGRTVFINSHLLSELEVVSDRVAILVKGVVAQQGTIDELTVGQLRYELVIGDSENASELLRKALGVPTQQAAPGVGGYEAKLPTGEAAHVTRNTLTVGTNDAAQIQPIIDRVRAEGGVITSVRHVRPSLEDLFMQAVTDPTTGEALKPGAEEGGKR